jgi:hypothetical protein
MRGPLPVRPRKGPVHPFRSDANCGFRARALDPPGDASRPNAASHRWCLCALENCAAGTKPEGSNDDDIRG